jgi:hypothetical protein
VKVSTFVQGNPATTQRYAHLSHETLLAATNSVNTALGGVFVPMVSASPAAQVQLVQ